MDKATLEQEVKDGKEAEMILNHYMVQGFLTGVRGDLFTKFAATKHDESSDRDEIWRKMQMVDWFIDTFESMIMAGNQAVSELTRKDNVVEKIHNKISD